MSRRRARTSLLAAALGLGLALTGSGATALPPALPTAPEGEATTTHLGAELEVTLSPDSTLPHTPSSSTLEAAPTTLTGTLDTPEGVTVVGLVWQGEGAELLPSGELTGASASLRVKQDGAWGPWQPMGEAVPAGDDSASWATDATVVIDAEDVQVELTGDVAGATMSTWTSSVTSKDQHRVAALPPVAPSGPTLAIGTREDWSAPETYRTQPQLNEGPKLGVTLHHTVTAPVYAPEQVPATLRAIHGYHAVTLGWGDLGYNMFVDQHGRVWEGRSGGLENNVTGAHAVGMNTDWFGLSVIGDHETQPVAPSQHPSLAASTAWVLNTHGADVRQTRTYENTTRGWTRTLPIFHGHRDVDATLCPGYHLVNLLDELRVKVAREQVAARTAVQRIGGANRYEVASAMAKGSAMSGVRTAYLAQGGAMADTLGLAPVAAATGAAVLLTKEEVIPSTSLNALTSLGVQEVVVVGGRETISPVVEDTLRARGLRVTRVDGNDRYATAANVSRRHPAGTGGTIYLASGSVLSDALGGAAAAAEVDAPMLLTRATSLPGPTTTRLAELKPSRVVLLGGPMTVHDDVLTQVKDLLPAASVERIGGADRYAVSAAVARDAFDGADLAVVASGQAPADAMTGTQLAASRGGPVLLVRPGCRPGPVQTAYDELGIDLSTLAGGEASIQWAAGSTGC